MVIIGGVLFGLTIMIMEFGLKSSGMLDDCFNTEGTLDTKGTKDDLKNILDQNNSLIKMKENENRSLKLRIAQLENVSIANALSK